MHSVFFLASSTMGDDTPMCVCSCNSTSTSPQSTSLLYQSTSTLISTHTTSDQSPPSSYILTTTATTTSQRTPSLSLSMSGAVITSSTPDSRQNSPFSDSLTTIATTTTGACASSSSVCYCPCSNTTSMSYMSCKYAYRKRLDQLVSFFAVFGGYTIDFTEKLCSQCFDCHRKRLDHFLVKGSSSCLEIVAYFSILLLTRVFFHVVLS